MAVKKPELDKKFKSDVGTIGMNKWVNRDMKIWLWFILIGIILFFIVLAVYSYDKNNFLVLLGGAGLFGLGLLIGIERLLRKAKYE